MHRPLGGGVTAALALVVLGTFLPWLRSGQSQRNCYQAGGVLRRLDLVHGLASLALRAAPLLAVVCALAVAGYLAGLRRSAASLSAVVAICAGAGAIGTLRVHGSGTVRAATVGPVVTLVGACSVIVAATLIVATHRGAQDRGDSTHVPAST